jgi:hypothetical protein
MWVSVRLLAIALVLIPASLHAQRSCRKGKPCGNTCIAQNRTCHAGDGNASPPSRQAPASASVPLEARSGLYAGPAGQTAEAWIASRAGHTYYRNIASCSAGQKLAVRNRIYFANEQAARDAGYSRSRSKGC